MEDSCGDEVVGGPARVAVTDQGLAHQDGAGALGGIARRVGGPGDAGLGDRDRTVGDERDEAGERVGVDVEGLEVAGVDADDGGTGVDGPVGLVLVVHLDQGGHAEVAGEPCMPDQVVLGQGGDDEQDEVGAVRPGLEQLVVVDHEVLAQHGDPHGRAHRVEVVEATRRTGAAR